MTEEKKPRSPKFICERFEANKEQREMQERVKASKKEVRK